MMDIGPHMDVGHGPTTFTLPSAARYVERCFTFQAINNSAVVIVEGADITLAPHTPMMFVKSDGSRWRIVSKDECKPSVPMS